MSFRILLAAWPTCSCPLAYGGTGRRRESGRRAAVGSRAVAGVPRRTRRSRRSNSIARRLPAGGGVRARLGGEEGARVASILCDRRGEFGERVVARFVAQLVQ